MTIDELIELINHTVYENEDGDITGEAMNLVLNAIVAAIGVEANPEDEATGTLTKIKIGEEAFDVEGGGGVELPDGALYGGFAYPNEQTPYYGDDHRYFYLAYQQGNYPAFNTELDGNSLVLFYWLEQGQAWYMGYLAVTSVGLQDALQRYLESNEMYMRLGFQSFRPNVSFSIGDFVTYEGGFYVFTANHPAGQWDEDDVAEASLVDYITDYVSKQLSGKQDTISDLAAIRSGAAAGATAYQKPSGGIPKTDLASGVQNTLDEVGDIADMIPAQASTSNQLADKNFVNSSITTSTANFVGTYNSLAELQAVQNPTNNDYGFVIETDAQGNQYYDRYKYNGTSWLFEYKVESTAFTAAQWAAIQSGITAALVNRLGVVIPAGATAQNPLATVGDIATIDVVDASTIPASMDADKVYQYGTLSGDTTFPALNTPTDLTVAHVYCWTFTTPATAPTITWPSAITSWAGGSAPTINESKSYEVSVMDGLATIIEA